ncbi:hypothetical protein FB561_3189 [Kribbella amoyensis]|uniref:Uncharacterized protein n=1 Tax=Kribbella amoyensis TaxID=996641 RepID=A0A561BTE4_9ACTN|nr:hypothetical protein [Kribbella amoyensis]TWD82063.1 hypothetical protein FB561_3189 [Kribbella amoyensis]
MTDASVDDLIRAINSLVVQDTGGVSLASGQQLPGVTRSVRARVDRLADNLDVPARLAPAPGEPDSRPAIRQAVTEVVANCAYTLAPEGPLPLPEDGDRYRFAEATSRAYAALATPRLLQQLMPEAGDAPLGQFPEPALVGDTAAARTVALGISGRTGQGEDAILTEMVAAGRGGAGPAAAELLMRSRPSFAQLSPDDRREVVEMVAAELEWRFSAGDRVSPRASVVGQRLDATARGAEAVDEANHAGDRATAYRHERSINAEVVEPLRIGLPTERPDSVHELLNRVQGAVGELTGAQGSLWNGRIEFLPGEYEEAGRVGQSPQGTLVLSEERVAVPLTNLTVDGPDRLTPGQVVAAREALKEVSGMFARFAVPEGYTRENEELAVAAAPRFEALAYGVGQAFTEDNLHAIVDRTVPQELAERLQATGAPQADTEWAPAARGLAFAVDVSTGRDADPSETLRALAGQGRAGAATVAAETLVLHSEIPRAERAAVIRQVAESVDRGFEALPERVASWNADGGGPGTTYGRSREYGMALGQQAAEQVRRAENESAPGGQQQDATAQRQDATARFAADPAVKPLTGVQPPAAKAEDAARSGRPGTPAEQQKPTGLDR